MKIQEIMYIDKKDVEKVNYTLNIYQGRVVNIVPVFNPQGAAYSGASLPFGAYVVIEYDRPVN